MASDLFHHMRRLYIKRHHISAISFAFLLIVILGCASQATPATSPMPPPSPTPSSTPSTTRPTANIPRSQIPSFTKVGWSADGDINLGEYRGWARYGDFEIGWNNDEKLYICIGMKAKTNGWVAVAFLSSSIPGNGDVVIGFVKDGKTTIYDQFCYTDVDHLLQDTDLGGTNDIIEYAGKEEGGYTTIEFKRKLDTGDEYDNKLFASYAKNRIWWFYGMDDNVTSKYINSGYHSLTLQ